MIIGQAYGVLLHDIVKSTRTDVGHTAAERFGCIGTVLSDRMKSRAHTLADGYIGYP